MTDDRPSLQCASPFNSSEDANSQRDQSQYFVDILVHDSQWQDKLSFDPQKLVEKCLQKTLRDLTKSKAVLERSFF